MKARNTTSSFSKREKCGGSLSTAETGTPLGSVSCRVRDHRSKVRADWIWVEPPESCSTPVPTAWFHRFRRPDPSPAELRRAADRVPAAVAGPPEHRVLLRATSKRLCRASICGNQMNLGVPSAARFPDGWRSVAPVPSRCTFTEVESKLKASTPQVPSGSCI